MSLSIPVQESNTRAADTLQTLAAAKGTLYVQDGAIRESKHPLGRAFLGLFSSGIRAENRAAAEAVSKAMTQVYGFTLNLDFLGGKIGGRTLAGLLPGVKEQNRASMDAFMERMSVKFGADASAAIEELRASSTYESGLAFRPLIRETNERLVLGREGPRFRNEDVSADDIFKAMNSMHRFRSLLSMTFGVGDMSAPGCPDLTIERHTRQVMSLYEQQKGHYDLEGLQNSLRGRPGFENFNANNFMKMVLLFHDIGKGQAFATGREQHEVTTPILRDTMKRLGFSEQEVRLAANLVDNDLLGEWQAGKRHDVAETRSRLRALAQDSGVPLKDYLLMQKLFYISDAGSYPPLRASFMDADANGRLHFTENKTDALISSFKEQFGAMTAEVGERLLAPNALMGGKVHPLELFEPSMTEGQAWNVYDVSRAVLEREAELSAHIETLESPLKETARARLGEAVEMARTALTMDGDRWAPEHTRGVIRARLEIREAGITAALPRQFSAPNGADMYDGKFNELGTLRGGPDSITARFYALLDRKGGNSRMLQCMGQQQVTSSWCGTSLAVKGYLERARSVSEERYFRPSANADLVGEVSRDSAEACYARFAHAPAEYWEGLHGRLFASPAAEVSSDVVNQSTAASNAARIDNPTEDSSVFDTSIRYQLAMQMEMFQNVDFPGNNRADGTVTVYRTEFPNVVRMYGLGIEANSSSIPPSLADDPLIGTTLNMRRSTYDSGSLYAPIMGTGTAYTTTQEIPYHRIFNSFLLGATPESMQSCMFTNLFHEVLFMTDGIPSTYVGNGIALFRQFEREYQPPPVREAPPAAGD
ncbi:MAG: hypothetical protein LBQ63_02595 [Deltaproteobacteria bacterium]|jgi:hypothetical protein|nr:hypothetical protein [Deltaproteobacteria bacterium]